MRRAIPCRGRGPAGGGPSDYLSPGSPPSSEALKCYRFHVPCVKVALSERVSWRLRLTQTRIKDWWVGPPRNIWEAEYRAVRRLPPWALQSMMRGSYNDFARGTPSERHYHEPPPVNHETMLWAWQFCQLHWMPITAIDKVALESTRVKGGFKPNFARKCNTCGSESEESIDKCASCGSTDLREPDPSQLIFIRQVFERPDPDGSLSMRAMFYRWARYLWGVSNWYMHLRFPVCPSAREEVAHDHGVCMKPVAFDVLPSEFTLPYRSAPLAFCPTCYKPDRTKPGDFYGRVCEDCQRDRYRLVAFTRWNWQGRPVARYHRDEVIHGPINVSGDGVTGVPRIISIGNAVRAMFYSELWDADSYSKNSIPDSMLVVPGVSTPQVQLAFRAASQDKSLDKSKRSLWAIGMPGQQAKEPKILHLIPDNQSMQREQMNRLHRGNIAAWAGVSEQTLGFTTPGKLGRETELLEVSENTVQAVQTALVEPINARLLPLYGVSDWHYELGSPKKDDLLRKADIQNKVLTNAQLVESLGREAEISEDGLTLHIGPPRLAPALAPPAQQPAAPAPPQLPPGSQLPALPAMAGQRQDPRNLPAGVPVAGIAGLEEDFVAASRAALDSEFSEAIRILNGLGARATREDVEEQVDAATQRLAPRLGALAQEFVTNMAELALTDAGGTFNRPDRNALAALAARPAAFFSAIRTFPPALAVRMRETVRALYEAGVPQDLKVVVATLRTAAGGEVWEIERIARSESTRLANAGRELAWRQGPPEEAQQRIYRWVAARDHRLDSVCERIAAGSPYTLDELKGLTASFGFGEWLPHPNCRCTVVRDTALLLTGEAEVP